ncbi:metal-dependent hydrolase [Deinococcus psychrotolerans]|uniref:metal-dependent hydrolase n=1 Tax=Deinococcus psychrotolerans TaxID=2489213 RepID=UPI001F1497F0|nr:metal-dependent hydrolase [Deinococcus psychrotolerans]
MTQSSTSASNLTIRFLGHSAFLFSAGDQQILIDPFLKGNPKCPVTLEEALSWKVDAVLLSHAHGDHWGNALDFGKTGTMIIGTAEIAGYAAQHGAVNTTGANIGGTVRGDWGAVTLTPAWHSSSFPDGTYGGMPTGLMIEMGGKRVYFAGDTSRFSDMALIGEGGLDLAILPIGDHYTMGPLEAAKCLDLLKPKAAMPMHYGTFPALSGDPKVFAAEAEKRGVTVYLPQPGDSVTL